MSGIINAILGPLSPESVKTPFLVQFEVEAGAGFNIGAAITYVSGGGSGMTTSAAWGQAVSNAGSPATPLIANAIGEGGSFQLASVTGSILGSGSSFSANYEASSALIAFESFTCYFHVYLQQVVTTTVGGVSTPVTTNSDMVLTASPVAGFCVPNMATFDESDATTWNASQILGPYAPTQPPDPTGGQPSSIQVVFSVVAFSCLSGYVPPLDGSGNGFPP